MPVVATTDATWVNAATVTYDAAELRRADAAIFSSGGVASGLTVTVDASDVVTVTSGRWVIDGDSTVTGTGVYRGGIGASASVALDARDATNSRIDLVVARQYDPDVVPAHTESAGKIEVITGTPAASPSAPAKPSLAVELARITVPASGGAAASVSTASRQSAKLLGLAQPAGGSVSVAMGGTSTKTGTITFPAGRFSSAPAVTLTTNQSTIYANLTSDPTTSSVNYRVSTRDGANSSVTVTLFWTAIAG